MFLTVDVQISVSSYYYYCNFNYADTHSSTPALICHRKCSLLHNSGYMLLNAMHGLWGRCGGQQQQQCWRVHEDKSYLTKNQLSEQQRFILNPTCALGQQPFILVQCNPPTYLHLSVSLVGSLATHLSPYS